MVKSAVRSPGTRRAAALAAMALLLTVGSAPAASRQVEVSIMRLQPGLNLVTAPLHLTRPEPGTALAGVAPLRVARYLTDIDEYHFLNPVAPTADFNLIPGRALWVQTNSEVELILNGTAHHGETYTVDLSGDEWTIAGIPVDHPVIWDADEMRAVVNDLDIGSLASNPEVVPPYAWIWNANRQQYVLVADADLNIAGATATIPAGAGFWLHQGSANLGTGQPGVRFDLMLGDESRSAASAGGWSLPLRVRGAGGESGLVVGVSGALTRPLEIAAPPAMGGAPRAALVGGGGRALYGVVDPRPSLGARRYALRIQAVDSEPISLDWPAAARLLPAGLQATLRDRATGRAVSLLGAGGYQFTARPGEVRELELELAPRPVGGLTVGVTAQAGRSRAASIAVTLSQTAAVRLTVRGLNGRVVRVLRPGDLVAGTTPLAWDGADADGRRVPAGNYRIEVAATAASGQSAGASTVLPLH